MEVRGDPRALTPKPVCRGCTRRSEEILGQGLVQDQRP